MPFFQSALLVSTFLTALGGARARGISATTRQSISLYWGQNSYGQGSGPYVQERLSYYCQNEDVDIIPLAFIVRVNGEGGYPETNFANAGDICDTFPDTSLLQCPEIEEDIKACQKMGKTILLSLGGATYTEGGFSSTAAAEAGATLLWNTFGPVPSSNKTKVLRPFGDAVIDGFDLDFESVVQNMPAFANKLRSLYAADESKTYYLTAAPQCVFPDAAMKDMLNGEVSFDAIWIQFYNNFCGLQSFEPGADTQNNFNYAVWDNWARTTSKNKDVRIYVGVPANRGAAGNGYQPVSALKPIIDYAAEFKSFGGVMMWDASQAYANEGFVSGVADALSGVPPPSSSHTTPSKTSSIASPTSSIASPTSATASPTATGQLVPQWGQCGGNGWTGPTQCAPPYKCISGGDWWWYCN